MEEILASIKRVINDDKRSGEASRSRGSDFDRSEPDAAEDVLELDAPIYDSEPLMSDERAAATRSSLAALAAVRQQQPAASAEEGPFEAAVKEMLRPILKQWLDERLPDMIEEMVAREISRITGQRF